MAVNLGEVLRAPQQLAIDQSDSTVSFGADLGPRRPLYLDGRATVDTLGDMTARSSKAKWKKGRLEVERDAGDFVRIRETYWIEDDRLIVLVKVEGPRKIEVRRVYLR
jgi:hypothetical protein